MGQTREDEEEEQPEVVMLAELVVTGEDINKRTRMHHELRMMGVIEAEQGVTIATSSDTMQLIAGNHVEIKTRNKRLTSLK